MKANMLSLLTPTTPGVGSKDFFFLKVVMLHIKLKWKKCRPTCKVTLWIYTHPWPLGLGLKVRNWKDLGQSPIQSAQFLKAFGLDNPLFTNNFLCLNQTLTFCAPSKIKVFGKYCILMSGHHGEGGGGIFCDQILFHRKSRFCQVLT